MADFGFATHFSNEEVTINSDSGKKELLLNTFRGTKRGYMPPEVLKLYYSKGRFQFDGLKADIFSLGVLLFSIVFNNLPFERARDSDK